MSYVNYIYKEKRNQKEWIIGKGITRSLNAFLIRLKHKRKLLNQNTPLIRLLILCNSCCIKLEWDSKPNQDYILSVRNINKISTSLVLYILFKEVEAIVSSRKIIIEGVTINVIKTLGINSKQKERPLLNKPQLILKTQQTRRSAYLWTFKHPFLLLIIQLRIFLRSSSLINYEYLLFKYSHFIIESH